ncbi:hypothetical protein [Actinomadura fibrosa]|uniref:Uncharacterized protein n=1 Tax=Actinomadura fibrosa TaxID=111802 RepID=A0ABW2XB64_9ACTN|nr:hypothetical protein [Actinomadura fibrosa]
MNGDAITLMIVRALFPHWSITLDGAGVWRAIGRMVLSASDVDGLLAMLHAADPEAARRAVELLEEAS